ncbi:hypothetical protein AGLY_009287 [Aphis glycines]|uniref:Uncharacterized protein n=1 Tax=Aphis glycines TaxID=307491 RepID=A0A6G0TJ83_APHGL|nr:hypothetical protein AGLY_009287 [Aphis glycines]
MKSYSVITVSIVLAFFAANTSAHDSFFGQDSCDVKYHLHENLASILENDVGIEAINELRQNLKDICLNPKAHNSIVFLADTITDVTTNTNVSQTLGNVFYWARKIMKDPKFRVVWHESMKGVNMCFDKLPFTKLITDVVLNNFNLLLAHPKFDTEFETVINNISKVINFRKNFSFKSATGFLTKSRTMRRSNSRNGQQ